MTHPEGSEEKPRPMLMWHAGNFPGLRETITQLEGKIVDEAVNTALKLEVTSRTALEIVSLRNSALWSQAREDAMVEADRQGGFLPMAMVINNLPPADNHPHA